MPFVLLSIYSLALLVLFVFGIYSLVMLIYHRRHRRGGEAAAAQGGSGDALPLVTVQLPLYNELHVAERLIDAVCRIDYPRDRLQVQVLDDSTDETRALVARVVDRKRREGVWIDHLHRRDRAGYKAGALRAGLACAAGELVAIFDADFLPLPDFLHRTVHHFGRDARLGMVQGRWEHLNIDYSLLTRLQAISLDAHFMMEQRLRNREQLFMNFNGTAGVWRAECIRDAGDWQEDTLTEDLDLSYRAQLRGWRFLFLPDLAVPAELPVEINGLKSQQFRWTKGAIETARKHVVALWRAKLPFRVKLHATIHLTSNLSFPCMLLAAVLNIPVLLLKQQHPELSLWFDLMNLCVVASVATLAFHVITQRQLRSDWLYRSLLVPFSMMGIMGLAVNNTRAVLEALVGRRSPFVRTPKYNIVAGGGAWQASRYRIARVRPAVIVELLLLLYFIVAIGLAVHYAELSLIPFQLMCLAGFGLTGLLSVRHAWEG